MPCATNYQDYLHQSIEPNTKMAESGLLQGKDTILQNLCYSQKRQYTLFIISLHHLKRHTLRTEPI